MGFPARLQDWFNLQCYTLYFTCWKPNKWSRSDQSCPSGHRVASILETNKRFPPSWFYLISLLAGKIEAEQWDVRPCWVSLKHLLLVLLGSLHFLSHVGINPNWTAGLELCPEIWSSIAMGCNAGGLTCLFCAKVVCDSSPHEWLQIFQMGLPCTTSHLNPANQQIDLVLSGLTAASSVHTAHFPPKALLPSPSSEGRWDD